MLGHDNNHMTSLYIYYSILVFTVLEYTPTYKKFAIKIRCATLAAASSILRLPGLLTSGDHTLGCISTLYVVHTSIKSPNNAFLRTHASLSLHDT